MEVASGERLRKFVAVVVGFAMLTGAEEDMLTVWMVERREG